ncbi:DeoR/GlpR family DNA-binding transcription regulator [Corynebacterium macclintockiae]|uniref:DeoR/GlpR family DNA-binding transcription regulator n=1 Tax=Corynebacterium macclintockiae TaxID=2913501 RepID=UPI00254B7BF4|nr:DeoR/GlpR family DNA-binding transcription regulator [Corynebacterium macclintockiae]MDK8890486.1 DeoR/GlpR family DNA-binding transcription regulator [Corynebacterium macclintockiae]
MESAERRRQIASLTAIHGRVTVNELAEKFGVTAETIRRDLAVLDEGGELFRVHGGAVPVQNFRTDFTTLAARSKASLNAKRAIAKAAVSLLPDTGSTVFIDAGTTTGIFAEAIAEANASNAPERMAPKLNIVTNSLFIATTLAESPRCDVQLIGGHVRAASQAVVGDLATRDIGVLHADVAFIGTNALTIEHGLSTPDAQEGAIKRAMVANSDRVVALCDSTKFGLDYLVSFASIQDIGAIVTDHDAPAPYVSELQNLGIEVTFPA